MRLSLWFAAVFESGLNRRTDQVVNGAGDADTADLRQFLQLRSEAPPDRDVAALQKTSPRWRPMPLRVLPPAQPLLGDFQGAGDRGLRGRILVENAVAGEFHHPVSAATAGSMISLRVSRQR